MADRQNSQVTPARVDDRAGSPYPSRTRPDDPVEHP